MLSRYFHGRANNRLIQALPVLLGELTSRDRRPGALAISRQFCDPRFLTAVL
jgi:hypothetical protein